MVLVLFFAFLCIYYIYLSPGFVLFYFVFEIKNPSTQPPHPARFKAVICASEKWQPEKLKYIRTNAFLILEKNGTVVLFPQQMC